LGDGAGPSVHDGLVHGGGGCLELAAGDRGSGLTEVEPERCERGCHCQMQWVRRRRGDD
jgi:hypothetical protein